MDQQESILTSLGNAGMEIRHAGSRVWLDPFYDDRPGLTAPILRETAPESPVEIIAITHDHWDHFNADAVAAAAGRTGARVVGPRSVVRALRGRLPEESLVELEPPAPKRDRPSPGQSVSIGSLAITAFRTIHGRGHNSYLLEWPDFRLFDDGDNERTECLDWRRLEGLDVLLLCPWQGSRWVEFLEATRPRRWLLIHLDADELEQHARGEFLPSVADRAPMEAGALRPGQAIAFRPVLR